MLAAIPAHLIHDLLAAATTLKATRHLPHWLFYPLCSLATFIVVTSVGSAILDWKEKRDRNRSSEA